MSSSTDGGANVRSPNFQFLKQVNPLLVEVGARAEHYALDDPNTSMIKVRQLGELLAQSVAANYGIDTTLDGQFKDQRTLIDDLYRSRALPPEIKDRFHEIRKEGNQAYHSMRGDQGRAFTLLRFARQVAVWFYRTYVNNSAKLGPFVPPVPTADTNDESRQEIARLQLLYEQATGKSKLLQDKFADESELRKLAEEERERAYEELETALRWSIKNRPS